MGPFSQGIELQGAVSLDGRWDVGFGLNRYATDLGGAADAKFTEWTPSVRYFFFKEDDDGTPVSVAGHAQYFHDDYGGANKGWYVLAGADVFKRLTLTDRLRAVPVCRVFAGGGFVQFRDRRARPLRVSDAAIRRAHAMGDWGPRVAAGHGGGAQLPARNVSGGASGVRAEILGVGAPPLMGLGLRPRRTRRFRASCGLRPFGRG